MWQETEPAYDEQSQVVQAVEFDYDSLDGDSDEADQLREYLAKALTNLIGWVNQSQDPRGRIIRLNIMSWIFERHLWPLTLTALAATHKKGKKGKWKQSYGRWVDDFKMRFPFLKNPHMKNELTRT